MKTTTDHLGNIIRDGAIVQCLESGLKFIVNYENGDWILTIASSMLIDKNVFISNPTSEKDLKESFVVINPS